MVRKISIIAVLLLCVALCGTSFAGDPRMGLVNMRKVFYEYKKTKDFNVKLEGQEAEYKEEVDGKTEEIRKLRDEIDMLSEEAREKKQPELRQKIKELDDFRRDKLEQFLREKDEMFKEIRKDILEVCSRYAGKNGYGMLFDEAIFVYAGENYDITDDIIKELNR